MVFLEAAARERVLSLRQGSEGTPWNIQCVTVGWWVCACASAHIPSIVLPDNRSMHVNIIIVLLI